MIGQTALIWEWNAANNNSITLGVPTNGPSRSRYEIEYDVTVDGSTSAGNYNNAFFYTAADAPSACSGAMSNLIVDADDVDQDGDMTENICRNVGRVQVVIPNGLAGLDSRKEVNGNLDAPTDFSRFPDNGMVSAGGDIIYRYSLSNPLATTVGDIVLVDVFPHVGDIGVVARNETRDSEWQPVVTATTVTQLQNYVNGINGAMLYFSTECEPCLFSDLGSPVVDPGTCANPNWSTSPPATVSDICAIKIEYGSNFTIPNGGSTTFDITLVAPPNVPTGGEIAWNSFGFTGVAGGTPLLASEPIKVGIASFPPPCSISGSIQSQICNNNSTDGNPLDDFYDMTVNATITNGSSTYEVLVDGQPISPKVTGTSGINVSFMIPASGSTAEITFRDDADNSCVSSAETTMTLNSCSDCTINGEIISTTCDDNNTGGNSTDDTYDIVVNATLTGGSGTYEVLVNGNPLGSTVTALSGNNATITLPADGNMADISFRNASDASCVSSDTTTIALNSCSNCSVSGSIISQTCNDEGTINISTDDTYDIEVSATITNGTSPNYEVLVNGAPLSPSITAASGTTTSINIPADGNVAAISFRDAGDLSCVSSTENTMALNSCYDCNVQIEIVDIGSCVGNNFDADVTVNWTNAPTGDIQLSIDGGAFMDITRPDNNPDATSVQLNLTGLVCNSTKTFSLRFEEEPSCFVEAFFVFPPTDPAGYIYCTETGEIITGGTISVTPPTGGSFEFLQDNGLDLDGSSGRYGWIASGSPVVEGLYTMSYTPPTGFSLTGTPGGFNNDTDMILDPNSLEDNPAPQIVAPDSLVLGSDTNSTGMNLLDFSAAANPFFLQFDLESGDPFVDLNNIPLTGCSSICTNPSSIQAFAIQASCTNGMVDANTAYLQLSAVTDATHVNWVAGSDYTAGDTDIANAIDISTESYPYIIATANALPNPGVGTTQDYTIRIFNGASNCFTDMTVTLGHQDCTVDCDCTEYLYLNEFGSDLGGGPGAQVHKFDISPTTGALTEIGSPWYMETMLGGLRAPHGLGTDLNGFLYIGESLMNDSDIRKFDSQGNLFPTAGPTGFAIPNTPVFNIGSIGNTVYFNPSANTDIVAYDICSGSSIGAITLGTAVGNDWGLAIEKDGTFLATSGFGPSNPLKTVYVFQPDEQDFINGTSVAPILSSDLISPVYSSDMYGLGYSLRGIDQLPNGDIVILWVDRTADDGSVTNSGNPTNSTIIQKWAYDAGSNSYSLATTVSDTQEGDGGYFNGIGIIYSETGNKLYVSSRSANLMEDCVAVFDTNLIYDQSLGVLVPVGTTGAAKGIASALECCPSSNNMSLENTICFDGSNTETIFLQDVLQCSG
ncbi:MAG: hypothetical protein AAF242_06595, partial [Bacteroidota bacterium]